MATLWRGASVGEAILRDDQAALQIDARIEVVSALHFLRAE